MEAWRIRGGNAASFGGWLLGAGLLRAAVRSGLSQARGWWDEEGNFHFLGASWDELARALTQDYVPSPIVAPWRRCGGYTPWHPTLAGVSLSSAARLEALRAGVAAGRRLRLRFPDVSEASLRELCRRELPAEALLWLDALYVRTSSGERKFPFLFGGGVGRRDFALHFAQCACEVTTSRSGSDRRLSVTLETRPVADEAWYATDDPWCYVLRMEGALTLSRGLHPEWRLEVRPARHRFPFVVTGEDGSPEWWVPLPHQPVSWEELHILMTHEWLRSPGGAARPAASVREASMGRGPHGIRAFARYGLTPAQPGVSGAGRISRRGFRQVFCLGFLAAPLPAAL